MEIITTLRDSCEWLSRNGDQAFLHIMSLLHSLYSENWAPLIPFLGHNVIQCALYLDFGGDDFVMVGVVG